MLAAWPPYGNIVDSRPHSGSRSARRSAHTCTYLLHVHVITSCYACIILVRVVYYSFAHASGHSATSHSSHSAGMPPRLPCREGTRARGTRPCHRGPEISHSHVRPGAANFLRFALSPTVVRGFTAGGSLKGVSTSCFQNGVKLKLQPQAPRARFHLRIFLICALSRL